MAGARNGELTERQREVLVALSLPPWDEFWQRSHRGSKQRQGARKAGLRKTLGSLRARGLAEYDSEREGWVRTPEGDAEVVRPLRDRERELRRMDERLRFEAPNPRDFSSWDEFYAAQAEHELKRAELAVEIDAVVREALG